MFVWIYGVRLEMGSFVIGVITMSHHFSSPKAKADGRLNLTDLYVFQGKNPDTTVFVINFGPDAGPNKSSPDGFHPDVIYDLNIDTDGDLKENLRYRFVCKNNAQWSLHRDDGYNSPRIHPGVQIAHGHNLGETAAISGGGQVWAGLAADPFVANVAGFFAFTASIEAGTPDYTPFDAPNNKFDGRDIMSIVIEIPNSILGGTGTNIRCWTTITGLEPDDEFAQPSRWGMPLAAFVVAGGPGHFDEFNSAHPFDVTDHEREHAIEYITKITSLTSPQMPNQKEYVDSVVDTYFIPVAMPYKIGTEAKYHMNGVNGRSLTDNVYDVIVTKMTNKPLKSGVDTQAPREDFPYLNQPNLRTDIPAVIDRTK
jgi:Domain of unknown function (DUF4331)